MICSNFIPSKNTTHVEAVAIVQTNDKSENSGTKRFEVVSRLGLIVGSNEVLEVVFGFKFFPTISMNHFDRLK